VVFHCELSIYFNVLLALSWCGKRRGSQTGLAAHFLLLCWVGTLVADCALPGVGKAVISEPNVVLDGDTEPIVMTQTALVLFSGGQDSTVCLAWALTRFERVETVGFDYRQRHTIELDCRQTVLAHIRQSFPDWGRRLGQDHMLDLGVLGGISDTALTQAQAIAFEANGVPNTFVPGRNLLFFTFAAAIAYRRDLKHLVGGMCETEYSGYPDCRDDTLKALQVALNLGMDRRFVVETPLMWIDKAGTWDLAQTLGGAAFVDLIREHTHTCYLGDRTQRHDWGYGCGACPACSLRASGYDRHQARIGRAG
jgi:7-cyano-7-deazaguanine synthase